MTFEDRFWSKVDVGHPLGCWEWAAGRYRNGYAQFSKSKGVPAHGHRIAYELLIGPIPNGLVLDHLCRNRSCVNPDHLEAVTQQENVRRGVGWRSNAVKAHCPQGHPYDEANTHVEPTGRRRCRACRNERSREWRKRPGSREKQAEYQRAYRARKKAAA